MAKIPKFFTAVAAWARGRVMPIPGGVLVRSQEGALLGTVWMSGGNLESRRLPVRRIGPSGGPSRRPGEAVVGRRGGRRLLLHQAADHSPSLMVGAPRTSDLVTRQHGQGKARLEGMR